MPVICEVCQKVYSTQFNLNKHLKNVHNYSKTNSVSYYKNVWSHKCLEEHCNSSYQQNVGLINHLRQAHNYQFEKESLEFEDLTGFQVWKASIEEQHKCNYVVSATFRSAKGKITYYSCNRSGKIRSRSQNKKLVKSQGSCKLDRSCTSEIRILESENINVIWRKTHYGHSKQLQHVRILKKDKAVVASKLINGVPASRILDVYRDKLQCKKEISRVDLITRKDISNIKSCYKIDIADGVKHKNDAMSVDLWVRQCEVEPQNPILFYKRQGEVDALYNLAISDFCLIIMTNFQKNMLEKFGSNIIAIDGTHGLNNYDFELTSIMVVDDFGEGIPVAFMFSNRKDTYIYEIYFSIIKSHVGIISPRTFMTDIVSTFSNAWNCVMEPALYQLFCSWHIDRAWQINLTKITDKEKRSNVYKTLKVLQQDVEVDNFEVSLVNFIKEMISDKDTYNFGIYFQNNCSLNYRQWAYSFRSHCGINTNMRLESMHKVIKYFYLDGKKVKRLDKSLHMLLKYVRDKCVDRLIKTVKGKYTIHTKHIIKRHNTALRSDFVIHTEEYSNKWALNPVSVDKKMNFCYYVKQISDRCCCDLNCVQCGICFHMYTCTCVDFSMKPTICKHIHFIALRFKKKEDSNQEVDNDKNEYAVTDTSKNTNNLKATLALKISESILKLQSVNLDSMNTDVMLQIHSHLSVIDNLISLQKNEVGSNYNFNPVEGGSNNEPTNKNISKQLTFYSTQKRKLPSDVRKIPNKKERGAITNSLQNGFNHLYLSNCASEDHRYI